MPGSEGRRQRRLQHAGGSRRTHQKGAAAPRQEELRLRLALESRQPSIGDDPDNPAHANLKAAALGRIGGYDEAITLYEELTRRFPAQGKLWMSYGHILKTVGRQDDSIASYRRALAADPLDTLEGR